MSILMVLIGAPIGAVIGSLFMHWLNDVAKERQQLESKTPYDYALTNANNERDRLQDELRTIQALKRTEADTERIRNEIDTILSDCGEEAIESVCVVDKAFMDSTDLTFRQYYDVIKTTDDKRHPDEAVSPTSWDARMSLEEWAKGVSKAFASGYGTNVREDDSEDEQSSEYDVERSLTEVVRESFENNDGIRVFWEDSHGRTRSHYGSANEIATADGKVKYFSVRGLEFSARDVLRITKGRGIDGETLYRKGNR